MICQGCKVDYPDAYLEPLEFALQEGTFEAASVCGPCALALINFISGQTRTMFTLGSRAEIHRRAALQHRLQTKQTAKPLEFPA